MLSRTYLSQANERSGQAIMKAERVVIARFMRATHFVFRDSKLGRPDKPGDDGFGLVTDAGGGVRWNSENRDTIPLSKHLRIRTNVLFQKNATNFALRQGEGVRRSRKRIMPVFARTRAFLTQSR
jgi:hypothetical protein